MMAVAKDIAYLGITQQAAKASAATSPAKFGLGVISGKVATVDLTQDYEDQTLGGAASDRFPVAVNRTGALPKVVAKTRAWKASIGQFALGVTGTADSVSGVGPYVHVITPTQALNYFTVFARYGTAEREKLVDCVFNSLGMSWTGRAPLEVDLELWSCGATLFHQADFTVTNDETTQPYMLPVGGTLQLDTGSATPAAGQVTGFTCNISNNLDPVELSKALYPDDLVPAAQTMEGTINLTPNDLSDWLKIITGTGTGTTLQNATQYGSLSMLVQIDANSQLTIAANRVEFMADFPDGDPKGGAAEIVCAYRVVRPTDGSAAYTLTVKNATVSYP